MKFFLIKEGDNMKQKPILMVILFTVLLVLFGCGKKDEQALDSREAAADKIVRQKVGPVDA